MSVRRRGWAAAALLAATGAATLGGLGASVAAASPAGARDSVTMAFDRGTVDLLVGDKFHLTTTVSNHGSAMTPPYVAHLNVASLTSDVYVDPEDWSPSRSKRVAPLAPGESATVTWDLQAVNSGWFDVYVVLLPDGSSTLGSGPLTVSPPVFATIGGRQTANPGGALPVVIGVPILLGAAAVGARRRLRRTRPETGQRDPA